mgnify:CR=1 FL=1
MAPAATAVSLGRQIGPFVANQFDGFRHIRPAIFTATVFRGHKPVNNRRTGPVNFLPGKGAMRKPLNDFRLQQQVRHCLSTLINGLGPAAKLAKPQFYGLVRLIQVPFRSPPSRLAP